MPSPQKITQFPKCSEEFLSIFSVEALAILETLQFIFKEDKKQVTIFSDSKTVLLATVEPCILGKSPPLIAAIKEELRNMKTQGFDIILYWISSHKGIKGNELADEKAK